MIYSMHVTISKLQTAKIFATCNDMLLRMISECTVISNPTIYLVDVLDGISGVIKMTHTNDYVMIKPKR